MCRICLVLIVGLLSPGLQAGTPDLAFKPDGDGFFSFDTGVVKGKLQADDKSQGMPTFVDVKTSSELAYGGSNPGILSYYRLLSEGKQWGYTARTWPKTAKLLPDGAIQVHWPAADDHPIAMTATYQWKSADTLDLETVVKPEVDLKRFEVFLSSYFNHNFRSLVYLASPRHATKEPAFALTEANPLVEGTYLAFPRDWRAAQTFYDGRWEQGPNPVQFSVTQFLAAPVALKYDRQNDITFVLMSRPEDCFAIEVPYDKDPPDGVAGHYSMYMSLFGRDVKYGETSRALVRLVVRRGLSHKQALDLYQSFLTEHGEKSEKSTKGE